MASEPLPTAVDAMSKLMGLDVAQQDDELVHMPMQVERHLKATGLKFEEEAAKQEQEGGGRGWGRGEGGGEGGVFSGGNVAQGPR
ncbi:MAG: hypothetical protein SGPRY_000656 [Prymnesium sp.]